MKITITDVENEDLLDYLLEDLGGKVAQMFSTPIRIKIADKEISATITNFRTETKYESPLAIVFETLREGMGDRSDQEILSKEFEDFQP